MKAVKNLGNFFPKRGIREFELQENSSGEYGQSS